MANDEQRELIYGYAATATFKGKRHQPCMHRTSECPDRCNHATTVYTFHLDSVAVTDPGSKHAKFVTALEEGKDHHVGEKDLGAAHLEVAAALAEGDKVEINWNHDYVTKGGASGPDRPVVKLVKL